MDREGANFNKSIESIKTKLGKALDFIFPILIEVSGSRAVGIQVCDGSGSSFAGAIDIVSMVHITNSGVDGETVISTPVLEDHRLYPETVQARAVLFDSLIDVDPQFMEVRILI